jgi:hypothetical protein
MSKNRLPRALVAVVAAVAATAGLSACGDDVAPTANIAAIDVRPDDVDRVVFTDAARSAEIKRIDGDWLPGQGSAIESIALLDAAEDRLFPVNAYRIIDKVGPEPVDQNDPNYGLAKPAPWSIDVYAKGGKKWHLSVGRPTFNQAGYYAKVDGDPKVYLIIAKTVSDIISIANGKVFEFEAIDKIQAVDRKFDDVAKEGKEGDLPDYDPWLNQVLAAKSGDMKRLHEAARRSSSIFGPQDDDEDTGIIGPRSSQGFGSVGAP